MGLLDRMRRAVGSERTHDQDPLPVIQFTVSFGDEVSTIEVPIDLESEELVSASLGSEEWATRRERRRSLPESSPDECWVRPGQPVEVAGFTIRAGLIYIGQGLRPSHERGWPEIEPALIDPTLEVSADRKPRSPYDYFLGYEDLSPAGRAEYLSWLAADRPVPARPDHVSLFLYGLERRVLIDPATSPAAAADRKLIVAELLRLLRGCEEEQHVAYEMRSLLGYLAGQDLVAERVLPEPPGERYGWETPIPLRVQFGRLAQQDRPLPVEWAVAWVFTSVEAWLRTPATRCREEFAELYEIRYRERVGDGLRLPARAKRIVLEYRPANRCLDNISEETDLPDVADSPKVVKALRELAQECCTELDGYSRWLGRNPDGRGTLPAEALLPGSLVERHASPALDGLRRWLAVTSAGERPWIVDGHELISRWPQASSEKLAKKDAVLLAELLEKLGYGLEPDVRFGAPPPASDSPAVLFPIASDAPATPSPGFAAATTLLQLAAAIAMADGAVTEDEERQLERHFESGAGLTEPERERLRAHTERLLRTKPSLSGLKRKLAVLSEEQRNALAKSLLVVAAADGHVNPDEIKLLTKIYELLGLEPASLYSQVHALTTGTPRASHPVTVRPAEPLAPGHAIPPEEPRGVTLDREKVEAKLEETAAVSSVLAGIFTDDGEPPAGSVPQQSDVAGLAADEARFARALAERSNWARAEVERLADEHGLMPDGALEALNEAAFERCDAPFWEGEDPVDIDPEVSRELLV